MTDFYPLLARIVADLEDETAEARHAVYDRTRAALLIHFGVAPGGAADATTLAAVERLEDAIAEIEGRYAGRPVPAGFAQRAGGEDAVTATPPVDERRRFAFNAAVGSATNLSKAALQILLLPVMARLLGPSEFGLYALAMPTITFFTTLADGGLGASLAREKETSRAVWSTAFWTLLGSCILVGLLTIVGGAVLAGVSGQPRLFGIMALLSLSFPLLGLTALPAARLVRRGNLVTHSVADLASAVIAAAVAIPLAASGAGAWALAIQYVVGWTSCCTILNMAAFQRPTLEFRFGDLRPHVMTGGSLIGSRLAELLGRQSENLLFARLFGGTLLGSYTFANQTSRFLCEAAGNPVWSALYSHALREDRRKLSGLHATLSRLLSTALFPASALLAASAPQLFDVMLGPKWTAAAELVQILVPGYALNVVAGQCGALILADGRGGSLFWTLSGLSAGRLLAFLAGPFAGPVGVAWGIDVANACYAFAMFVVVRSTTAGQWRVLVRDVGPPAAASCVAGLLCHALIALRPVDLGWTLISIAIGACVFVLGMAALQGRRLIADTLAFRRIVLSR